MDARNRKLRTGLLVAILVTSAFFIAPVASAASATTVRDLNTSHGQPAGFEDITNTSATISGSGTFQYNTNTRITVANITASGAYYANPDHYDLFNPQWNKVASADTSNDNDPNAAPHTVNVTFGGVLLDQVGVWHLVAMDSSGSTLNGTYEVLNFYVGPKTDMNVAVTPSTLKFPDDNSQIFDVKVTDMSSGSAVSGAKVFFEGNYCQTTGSDGMASCTVNFATHGVGTYTVEATKSTTGTPAPERNGTAQVTVTTNTLDLDKKTESPIYGFTSANLYLFSYPGKNSTNPLGGSDVHVDHWNVTVMNGSHVAVVLNSTESMPKAFDNGHGSIGINASGYLNVTDRWSNNDYKVIVKVDWNGDNAPEYTYTRTFHPAKPADVNLQLKAPATPVDVTEIGTPHNWGPNWTLKITGNKENLHPAVGFSDSNLTVSGDFVTDSNGPHVVSYNPATGVAQIIGVRPSTGHGSITFTVHWGGHADTSLKVKVDRGAVSSVSPSEVTVQNPTKVTVHIEDVFGNPVPDANVSLFWANTTTKVAGTGRIVGNGAPGHGQGGNYAFTVNASTIGRVWARGTIGHHNDTNFTYAAFDVVPAHDLKTTAAPASSTAGYSNTFTVNVTRHGSPFEQGGNDKVWFLNNQEWTNFQNNGSSALGAPDTVTRDSLGNYSEVLTFAPGTYHVYVQTQDGLHDNAGNESTLTVHAANATYTPSVLITKVMVNGTITVHVTDADGNPLNGTLAVSDGAGNATYWNASAGTISVADSQGGASGSVAANMTGIPVVNGVANITNVTTEHKGWIHVYFKGDGASDVYAPVSQDLQIQPPHVDISPKLIYVGETNRITVTVTNPITGAPLAGQPVLVSGGGVGSTGGTTDNQGRVVLSIFPLTTSPVSVFVNGEKAGSFTPVAGLSIQFDKSEYTVGDNVTVTVIPRGSTGGVAGVQVFMDNQSVGATGANGQVTFSADSAGTHTIRAVKQGFANATAQFTTKTKQVTPPPCKASFSVTNLQITPQTTTLQVGTTYTVSGTVKNTASCAGTIQLEFKVQGVTTQVQTYQFGAGETKNLGFTWTPNQPGDSITVAIAGGGASASHTVKVQKKAPGNVIPGFTTVGALAALGAALVLLQRRREH